MPSIYQLTQLTEPVITSVRLVGPVTVEPFVGAERTTEGVGEGDGVVVGVGVGVGIGVPVVVAVAASDITAPRAAIEGGFSNPKAIRRPITSAIRMWVRSFTGSISTHERKPR